MDEIKDKNLNNSIENLRIRINAEKSRITLDNNQIIKKPSFFDLHVRNISLFIALTTILLSLYPILSNKFVTRDENQHKSFEFINNLESTNKKQFSNDLIKQILSLKEKNARLEYQINLRNEKINFQTENLSILSKTLEKSKNSILQINDSLDKITQENKGLKKDLLNLSVIRNAKNDTHLKIQNKINVEQDVVDLNQNLAVLITKTKIQQKKINSALIMISQLKKERDDLISKVSRQSNELIQLSKLYP